MSSARPVSAAQPSAVPVLTASAQTMASADLGGGRADVHAKSGTSGAEARWPRLMAPA